MEAFSDFWNSGVPRIGDLEAKGWANYYSECGKTAETCDFEFVEQQAQMQQIYQLEEKSVSLQADELSNAQSEVTIADVRILTCCGDDAIFILLRLLGVHLNKSHSYLIFYQSYQLLTCAPTFHLLDEWNLMTPSKKLFTIPSAGARNIALNMIYGFFKIRPSMNFVATLLETKASQLDDLLSDRPTGIRITTMRDFLREFMTTFENVNTGIARVEFESAVAAYTLILFARWVREDNIDVVQVPEHRASNEKKKKQKKIKKGDRQFTSSQYVEKLKEFVHKIIDTPLLMGSMQLQILLRTLLSLVQAVPHSSVLDIITRILLRKGYEEKIKNFMIFHQTLFLKLSPTDALAALNEWKRLFRTTEDFSKPISCFESPRALCIALRIHFDYARASQHSDQWVEQCEKLFELINHFEAPDDRSVILSAYLDVLEHNWKHRHTLKSKLLIALEKGRKICPHDSSVIHSTLDMYSSLALIYLEKLRIRRLQDAGVAVPTDVLARTARAEASRKFDPALWRLAIAYAQSKSFIDETHVLALAQCAWSRHLHIDYIAACGSREKCKDVIRLMEQRGARVFNYLDYIDVLGEPANLQP
uniref:Uncharacterized protein n=1 Tax=Angiostrongylus cantonensis TaxID=6313 RepID=A0A0K0DGZ6_ANGCA